jgi:uncharacterized protein (DUF1330 family)
MEEPVYMLNALWFKKNGGQEKYLEYGAAAIPLLNQVGAEVKEYFHPQKSIIGEWDPDAFFLVKYPSKEAFEAMINSRAFQEISHLREEALEKSLLVSCKLLDWNLST